MAASRKTVATVVQRERNEVCMGGSLTLFPGGRNSEGVARGRATARDEGSNAGIRVGDGTSRPAQWETSGRQEPRPPAPNGRERLPRDPPDLHGN